MKGQSIRLWAAGALGVLVAVLFVGWLGMMPHWGETGPAAFAVALLGLWALGTVIGGRAWTPKTR
jgi:hypothetical protein